MKVKSTIIVKPQMSRVFLSYFGIIRKYQNIIQKKVLYELRSPIDDLIEIIDHQKEMENFLAELRGIGFEYKLYQETTYNKEELLKFDYAYLDLTNIARKNIRLEDDLRGPEKFGTKFTAPKCLNCNSDRTIKGDFYLPDNLDISFDMGFIYPSIIIKREACEIFQKEGLTGCSFKLCLSRNESEKKSFYRICFNNILPHMSKKNELDFIKCEKCGREYLKYCPDSIFYSVKDKEKFTDFNISVEQINVLGKNRVSYGIPIVSNRVIKLILGNRLTGITLKPIFFSE